VAPAGSYFREINVSAIFVFLNEATSNAITNSVSSDLGWDSILLSLRAMRPTTCLRSAIATVKP
jgi:hypothetical protein